VSGFKLLSLICLIFYSPPFLPKELCGKKNYKNVLGYGCKNKERKVISRNIFTERGENLIWNMYTEIFPQYPREIVKMFMAAFWVTWAVFFGVFFYLHRVT
jgi:hypothetical protein